MGSSKAANIFFPSFSLCRRRRQRKLFFYADLKRVPKQRSIGNRYTDRVQICLSHKAIAKDTMKKRFVYTQKQ